jgi:hypothetical protein
MKLQTLLFVPILTAVAAAQVVIPDGTKIRLRLDQTLSSATAEEGQSVELSVAEGIKVDGVMVVKEGARATGTVVMAQEKRRMGRAGKLDFSVDRVRAVNGEWLPVRYTMTKKTGDSKAVSTGIITAGVAVVFWPAAPFVLLRHGKDTTVNKGMAFDVFIEGNHTVASEPPAQVASAAQPPAAARPAFPAPAVLPVGMPAPAASVPAAPVAPMNPADLATVTFTSSDPGADIEINGSFVGNTPTTLKLAGGQYVVTIRKAAQVWTRTIQVSPGSSITMNAAFEAPQIVRRARN